MAHLHEADHGKTNFAAALMSADPSNAGSFQVSVPVPKSFKYLSPPPKPDVKSAYNHR